MQRRQTGNHRQTGIFRLTMLAALPTLLLGLGCEKQDSYDVTFNVERVPEPVELRASLDRDTIDGPIREELLPPRTVLDEDDDIDIEIDSEPEFRAVGLRWSATGFQSGVVYASGNVLLGADDDVDITIDAPYRNGRRPSYPGDRPRYDDEPRYDDRPDGRYAPRDPYGYPPRDDDWDDDDDDWDDDDDDDWDDDDDDDWDDD